MLLVQVLRTALRDTLSTTETPKVVRGILSMEELMQTPGREEMDHFINDRVDAGIWLKVLRSAQKDVEPIWPSSNETLRELRYCLSIDSVEFAAMQRTLFDTIWALSAPGR